MDQSIDVKGYKHNYIINTGNMDGFDCYRKLLNSQTHKAAFIHGNSFGTNVVIYHSIFLLNLSYTHTVLLKTS